MSKYSGHEAERGASIGQHDRNLNTITMTSPTLFNTIWWFRPIR